jgi:hypothetical protein
MEQKLDGDNIAPIKDLSITKEVLEWLVDGIYANFINLAVKDRDIKNIDENMRLKAQNVLALRTQIRDAETEEELKAIDEKLKGYWFSSEHDMGNG